MEKNLLKQLKILIAQQIYNQDTLTTSLLCYSNQVSKLYKIMIITENRIILHSKGDFLINSIQNMV